jgi:hypothetical protein
MLRAPAGRYEISGLPARLDVGEWGLSPERIVKIVMEYLIPFATFARPQKVIDVPDEATKTEVYQNLLVEL